MSRLLLNVADICLRSRVNGPGLRSVVWVQGCSRGCPGCFNPHTHPHEKRHLFDPEDLGHQLAKLSDTDGISISGGEPFEQAKACAILAETVRTAGRTVMVFTGHSYRRLTASTHPAIQRFLHAIDLLIAGPYVEELKTDGSMWRASSNQTIHLLTGRLRHAVAAIQPEDPTVEVVSDGESVLTTGFPDQQDQQWLERVWAQAGNWHRESQSASPKGTRAQLHANAKRR